MYILETRTGSGVTRRIVQGDIKQSFNNDPLSANFLANTLPLDMLPRPPMMFKKKHEEGPTDEELDAIEAESDE